jgi:hypothetical protein
MTHFRWTSVLASAALLVGSLAASAAAALALWAWLDPPRSPFDSRHYAPDQLPYLVDREMGWRAQPGFEGHLRSGGWEGKGTMVRYDSRGARISSAQEPDVAAVDILVVGCSQAWGQGVAAESTLGAQLAELLGLTERNFSNPGFGGVASATMIRRQADLRPKYVVYGMWFDHLNRNTQPCAAVFGPVCIQMPHYETDGENLRLVPPPSPESMRQRLFAYARDTGTIQPAHSFLGDMRWTAYTIYRAVWDWYHGYHLRPWTSPELQRAAAEAVLADMRGATAEIGARLVVVYIPDYLSGRVVPAPDWLPDAAAKDGALWVDMSERFARMLAADEPVGIPGDMHLTERAHRAAAEETAYVLRRFP